MKRNRQERVTGISKNVLFHVSRWLASSKLHVQKFFFSLKFSFWSEVFFLSANLFLKQNSKTSVSGMTNSGKSTLIKPCGMAICITERWGHSQVKPIGLAAGGFLKKVQSLVALSVTQTGKRQDLSRSLIFCSECQALIYLPLQYYSNLRW